MRRFTIIAAISVIALIVVAKIVLFGRAASTEAAVASIDSGPSSDWTISGQIEAMNGNFWVIHGFSIRVNDDTRVSGVIPTVGAFAMAEGIVQTDATWLATRIRVSDHEDFTPTPVDSPTATATPTGTVPNTTTSTTTATPTGTTTNTPTSSTTATPPGTVPNTPTPTATAVAPTPTFTSTRVATSTEVSDPDDRNDDGDRNDNGDDKSDKTPKPPHPNPDNNGKHLGNGHGHGNQNDQDKGPKGKKGD